MSPLRGQPAGRLSARLSGRFFAICGAGHNLIKIIYASCKCLNRAIVGFVVIQKQLGRTERIRTGQDGWKSGANILAKWLDTFDQEINAPQCRAAVAPRQTGSLPSGQPPRRTLRPPRLHHGRL